MGIELILGAVAAVVGVVGGVAQANAASRAADAQKEANAISAGQQEVAARESRRQAIREERIRRAKILASAENTGTSNSSAAIAATGALTSNIRGIFANSRGESAANRGINANLQRAADFTAEANFIGAITDSVSKGFSGFASIFDQ
jgi:hypothetical protein